MRPERSPGRIGEAERAGLQGLDIGVDDRFDVDSEVVRRVGVTATELPQPNVDPGAEREALVTLTEIALGSEAELAPGPAAQPHDLQLHRRVLRPGSPPISRSARPLRRSDDCVSRPLG